MYGDILYLDLKEVIHRTNKIPIPRIRKRNEVLKRSKKSDVQIIKRRKSKESTNSSIFKHILFCLASEQHIHMLKDLKNGKSEFAIKYINKKSPNWTDNDISLFKDLDRLSSKVREEHHYEESCKVRFKANISKLCKRGFLKCIHTKVESKSVKWKIYRVLKQPLNGEKMPNSRKKKLSPGVSGNLSYKKDENALDIQYRSYFENKSCTQILAHTTSKEKMKNFYSSCESHLRNETYLEQNTQTSAPEKNTYFNVDDVFQCANLHNGTSSNVIDSVQSPSHSYEKLMINNDFEQSMENYEELMINNDPLLSSVNQIDCLGQLKRTG